MVFFPDREPVSFGKGCLLECHILGLGGGKVLGLISNVCHRSAMETKYWSGLEVETPEVQFGKAFQAARD